MRKSVIIAFGVLLLAASGCVVFNRNNTPTINWFEDNVIPSDKVLFYATAPVTLPLGFVAMAIDAVIVRPSSVLDDAGFDTRDALWEGVKTPVLDFVDQHMIPAEDPLRSLSYPVTGPLAYVAMVTDALAVRQEKLVDDAWDMVDETCWDDIDWDDEYVTECALVIPRSVGTGVVFTASYGTGLLRETVRVALTPIAYAGAFLYRSCFNVPEHRDSRRRRELRERQELERQAAQDRPPEN